MELIFQQKLIEALPKQKLNWGFIALFLMRTLKIPKLNNLYRSSLGLESIELFDPVLSSLIIVIDVEPGDLNNIPAKSGIVVVSNHLYGGLDGLIMLRLFLQARHDLKVLV